MNNKDHQPEGDFFIGARLSARRQKLGIQVDKAAKDIRISASRLSQIEADDFSSFAHPTYARLFLVDYANYLRVPLEEIRDYLPGSTIFGLHAQGSGSALFDNLRIEVPSAIPEPGTWALMLLGLGVAGGWARRQAGSR